MSDSGLFLWPDWRLEADDAPVIDTEDTPGRRPRWPSFNGLAAEAIG